MKSRKRNQEQERYGITLSPSLEVESLLIDSIMGQPKGRRQQWIRTKILAGIVSGGKIPSSAFNGEDNETQNVYLRVVFDRRVDEDMEIISKLDSLPDGLRPSAIRIWLSSGATASAATTATMEASFLGENLIASRLSAVSGDRGNLRSSHSEHMKISATKRKIGEQPLEVKKLRPKVEKKPLQKINPPKMADNIDAPKGTDENSDKREICEPNDGVDIDLGFTGSLLSPNKDEQKSEEASVYSEFVIEDSSIELINLAQEKAIKEKKSEEVVIKPKNDESKKITAFKGLFK